MKAFRQGRPARDGTRERELSDDLLRFDTTLPTSCLGLSAGRTQKKMISV